MSAELPGFGDFSEEITHAVANYMEVIGAWAACGEDIGEIERRYEAARGAVEGLLLVAVENLRLYCSRAERLQRLVGMMRDWIATSPRNGTFFVENVALEPDQGRRRTALLEISQRVGLSAEESRVILTSIEDGLQQLATAQPFPCSSESTS